jgi:hypothetical protein
VIDALLCSCAALGVQPQHFLDQVKERVISQMLRRIFLAKVNYLAVIRKINFQSLKNL